MDNTKQTDAATTQVPTEPIHVSEDEQAFAKRVLRKIDWRLIPLMFLTYNLNFMDKTILSSASVFGLREDTVCHSSTTSKSSLTLYIGFERPTVLLGVQCILLWLLLLGISNNLPHHPDSRGQVSRSQYVYMGSRCCIHSSVHQLWRSDHCSLPFGSCRSHYYASVYVYNVHMVDTLQLQAR